MAFLQIYIFNISYIFKNLLIPDNFLVPCSRKLPLFKNHLSIYMIFFTRFWSVIWKSIANSLLIMRPHCSYSENILKTMKIFRAILFQLSYFTNLINFTLILLTVYSEKCNQPIQPHPCSPPPPPPNVGIKSSLLCIFATTSSTPTTWSSSRSGRSLLLLYFFVFFGLSHKIHK